MKPRNNGVTVSDKPLFDAHLFLQLTGIVAGYSNVKASKKKGLA
jgi:hypothetical protein